MGGDHVALANRLTHQRRQLSMETAVSLIICTRKRVRQLEAYLAPLARMSGPAGAPSR